MENTQKKKTTQPIRKIDFLWLIILSLLLSTYLFTKLQPHKEKLYATINLYDKEIAEIELKKNSAELFTFKNIPNVIFERSNDGKFRIKQSDCPRQICVNTGYISQKDEIIACLPKGIIIRIVDSTSNKHSLIN